MALRLLRRQPGTSRLSLYRAAAQTPAVQTSPAVSTGRAARAAVGAAGHGVGAGHGARCAAASRTHHVGPAAGQPQTPSAVQTSPFAHAVPHAPQLVRLVMSVGAGHGAATGSAAAGTHHVTCRAAANARGADLAARAGRAASSTVLCAGLGICADHSAAAAAGTHHVASSTPTHAGGADLAAHATRAAGLRNPVALVWRSAQTICAAAAARTVHERRIAGAHARGTRAGAAVGAAHSTVRCARLKVEAARRGAEAVTAHETRVADTRVVRAGLAHAARDGVAAHRSASRAAGANRVRARQRPRQQDSRRQRRSWGLPPWSWGLVLPWSSWRPVLPWSSWRPVLLRWC